MHVPTIFFDATRGGLSLCACLVNIWPALPNLLSRLSLPVQRRRETRRNDETAWDSRCSISLSSSSRRGLLRHETGGSFYRVALQYMTVRGEAPREEGKRLLRHSLASRVTRSRLLNIIGTFYNTTQKWGAGRRHLWGEKRPKKDALRPRDWTVFTKKKELTKTGEMDALQRYKKHHR